MLSLTKVDYYYHNELFHFDVSVEQGSITALMGPSGAGKSTLLALVAGFIEPVSGSISVEGHDIVGLDPHRRPFAMLFQEHNLFAHLTVRQNIGLGLHPGLKLSDEQQRKVELAAQQVGVADYLDRLPEQLSGGQRQRVALARCFVQSHPVWLLDEPFSALDPILREEMLSLVAKLAKERNITVLMVTHHISDAKAIGSDFIFVANGRVAVAAGVEQLVSNHSNQALSEFVRAGE
ncbi:thiamine ABC transporter ATP-binding protein [Vibrio sinaloensis]|uniref:thiamine ABC transporter ATP-binding protein n=1 Tax=Photobacterium sp. (strain ATCC 43367) TaxID=379097 RepID=UPI00057F782B|nr:thiamine ABC transporter ATP-binding protein [Vibrio sinaloensis]KHT38288.1 thiamine ABC transporter ATP-binding protein [Vibrio sinaloensis]